MMWKEEDAGASSSCLIENCSSIENGSSLPGGDFSFEILYLCQKIRMFSLKRILLLRNEDIVKIIKNAVRNLRLP